MVDISGLDKALVLKALWDNSKMQGLSYLAYKPINLEDCRKALETESYFDYFCGKVIKVDLSGDSFNPIGYDRDNGEGAAQQAINTIK